MASPVATSTGRRAASDARTACSELLCLGRKLVVAARITGHGLPGAAIALPRQHAAIAGDQHVDKRRGYARRPGAYQRRLSAFDIRAGR